VTRQQSTCTATAYPVETWTFVQEAQGDESGMVRIWDANTGIEVYHFQVSGAAASNEWSPDGSHVIIAGSFQVPEIRRVWPSTEALVAYAREHCVQRELTAEERAQLGLSVR